MKSKFNKYVLIFILIISVALLFSITDDSNMIIENQVKSYRVIVIFKNSEMTEYWKEVKTGLDVAAEDYNIELTLLAASSESDVEGQIQLMEKAIEESPDALIIASNDFEKLVPVSEKVISKGIPLVMIDSGVSSNAYDCFVSTDNYEAGYKAGIEMSRVLNSGDQVNIMSYVKGSQTAIEREEGVRDGLLESGKEFKVETYFCFDDEDAAYRITHQFFDYGITVDGIIGLNETSTVGVAHAIDDLSLNEDIRLIGFDSSIEEIKFLENGTIHALIVQKPFNMGYLGLETAYKLMKNESVEQQIDTGSQLVTKDTMYDKENIDLLFPFKH